MGVKGIGSENVQGLNLALKMVERELNIISKQIRQNTAIKSRTLHLEKRLMELKAERTAVTRVKLHLKKKLKACNDVAEEVKTVS